MDPQVTIRLNEGMMQIRDLTRVLLFAAIVALIGCGGGSQSDDARETPATRPESGLTDEQLEKGIGPISLVELGELDAALAARGEEVFTLKCSACHRAADRYVGPALADILERRAPEYVMNMILNPAEMLAKHPEAKKLLAEFMTPMPDQNLTEADARAVLEYLRSLAGGDNQATEQ